MNISLDYKMHPRHSSFSFTDLNNFFDWMVSQYGYGLFESYTPRDFPAIATTSSKIYTANLTLFPFLLYCPMKKYILVCWNPIWDLKQRSEDLSQYIAALLWLKSCGDLVSPWLCQIHFIEMLTTLIISMYTSNQHNCISIIIVFFMYGWNCRNIPYP
jgi:hypothetical protein